MRRQKLQHARVVLIIISMLKLYKHVIMLKSESENLLLSFYQGRRVIDNWVVPIFIYSCSAQLIYFEIEI